uniref:Uncharacterized protein n=1 Tax=Arundo donax TaxID=35708 RepID=A0A0A9C217_ARUDO
MLFLSLQLVKVITSYFILFTLSSNISIYLSTYWFGWALEICSFNEMCY